VLGFVLRRLIIAIPVLLGILVIAFVFVHLLPGDPVRLLVDPSQLSGAGSTQYLAQKRIELGLDKPLPVQWVLWMREVLTGNLGFSFQQRVPVLQLIQERVGSTVLLTATAVVLAVLVAIPVGVLASLKQNSVLDYLAGATSMLAISIPVFFLGLLAIYVFALQLNVLPSGGRQTLGVPPTLSDTVQHLIMPAAVLAAVLTGPYVRYVRQSMLDVLRQDYITTAVAKGASPLRVVLRHALRNALISLTTVLAVQIPALLAGTVVIETVFAWPGLGLLVFQSIEGLDYPVILSVVMMSAVLVLLCNLVADVLAAVLDPRIRL
jgi:peptide/nickel transport system permease protein